MEKVSGALAKEWSIELEKGLRSKKPDEAIEAILRMGPRLEMWSREQGMTMAMSNMFGLVQGEDRLFANSILLRLASAFKSCNNDVRYCILKVFLSEFKYRIKQGKNYKGILAKERVSNHLDLLKRVKFVFDTADVEGKALSLRLFGCWADFAKDSATIRHVILSSLGSCDSLQRKATLFAAGCFCQLSEDFSHTVTEILTHMLASPKTSTDVKFAALHTFGKMQCSTLVSNRYFEIGRKMMMELPQEFRAHMVASLSKLACHSIMLIPKQVDFLLFLLSSDTSHLMQGTALRCMRFLLKRGVSHFPFNQNLVSTLLGALDNYDLPDTLHFEVMDILRKIFQNWHQGLLLIDANQFHALISRIRMESQSLVISKRLLSFGLLVDISCSLGVMMTRGNWIHNNENHYLFMDHQDENNTSINTDENNPSILPLHIISLILDRVSLLVQQAILVSNDVQSTSECKHECQTLLYLTLRMVDKYPSLGFVTLDGLKSPIEALVNASHTFSSITSKVQENFSRKGIGLQQITACSFLNSKLRAPTPIIYELLICIYRFMNLCLEILDESNAFTDQVKNTVIVLSECMDNVVPFDHIMFSILKIKLYSIIKSHHPAVNFNDLIEPEAGGDDDIWFNHESLILDLSNKSIHYGCRWEAYKSGRYAACQGIWFSAAFTFKQLTKCVQSNLYCQWLKSLAFWAGAESEILLHLFPKHGSQLVSKMLSNFFAQESCSNLDNGLSHFLDITNLSSLEQKLVTSYGRIVSSREILSSSTSNCSFYFQMWFLSIRAKVLNALADAIGLSCFNLSITGNKDDDEDPWKLMHSLTCRSSSISFCLLRLAKEIDLLATSFMDIDVKSYRNISRLALNCSFMAFCITFSLYSPNFKNIKRCNTKDREKCLLILDLAERLKNVDKKICTDLRLFLLQTIEQSPHSFFMSPVSQCGHAQGGSLEVCRLAISGVLCLQEKAKGVMDEKDTRQFLCEGLGLFRKIIIRWMYISFCAPKYFFRVRPCIGAELFVTSADHNNASKLSVLMGSCLSLNICIQLKNFSPKLQNSVTKLYCILSTIRNDEITEQNRINLEASDMDRTMYLSDKLFSYIRGCGKNANSIHGSFEGADTFVCLNLNEKGQGFSTCLLDVSQSSMGSYQIIWHCYCIDTKDSLWNVLPLNAGPAFNIQRP